MVPVTILFPSLDAKQQSAQREGVSPNSEDSKPGYAVLASMLFKTVKQPMMVAEKSAIRGSEFVKPVVPATPSSGIRTQW
jgi:hypothetical protein